MSLGVKRHDMAPGKSIMLIVVSLVQTIIWLPYLSILPWTLSVPVRDGRWIIWWCSGTFDLGTATDFFPAVMMVIAGLLAVTIGFRRRLTNRIIRIAVWLEVLAVAVLVAMDVIGAIAGVVRFMWTYSLLLVLLVAPPITTVLLLRRRRLMIQPLARSRPLAAV
jgi:hypothetical protein